MKVLFWVCEVCFLFVLGFYFLFCEFKSWRFWHSVKCLKTFWDGEAWVTVEE